MTSHTPGPWRAEKHPQHDHAHRSELWTIIAGEPDDCCDAEIAQVIAYEAEANARLIAAAPVLLEALRILANEMACYGPEDDPDTFAAYRGALAAIAKAGGE